MCIIELQSCAFSTLQPVVQGFFDTTDEILLDELEAPTLRLPTAYERVKLDLSAAHKRAIETKMCYYKHFVTDMSMQEPGILGTCFCQTARAGHNELIAHT